MSNNKQSSVRWLIKELDRFELGTSEFFSKTAIINHADRFHEKELDVAYGNGYEQGEMDFYKKMQCKGDKYAEGYSEGYQRALELVKWEIDNNLKGGNK